jgi:hypothetical protein
MRALSAGLKPGLRVDERPVDVVPELESDGNVPVVAGAEYGSSVSK